MWYARRYWMALNWLNHTLERHEGERSHLLTPVDLSGTNIHVSLADRNSTVRIHSTVLPAELTYS